MSSDRALLVFGAGDYADVAGYYFTEDAGRRPVGFVVDDEYAGRATPMRAPVLAWSEAVARFPPSQAEVFVAIGYSGLNRRRVDKMAAVEQAGYQLASFVHSRAVVWSGFERRDNCFILEQNVLQPFTTVGRGVVIWSGNHIGHHTVIEEGCFLASHIVIAGGVRLGAESFVGINATIRDHVTIGRRNVIGAGALILGDTPDGAVFKGTPTPMAAVSSDRLRAI